MVEGLSVRSTQLGDAEALWGIACDPLVVRFSFEAEPIDLRAFEVWLAEHLQRKDVLMFTGLVAQQPMAYVRFIQEGPATEVDLAVAQAWRKRGYGARLLSQSITLLKQRWPQTRELIAVVHCENTASEHLFTRCGFERKAVRTRRGVPVHWLQCGV
jgi:RimJ/RimL family protein N-acetyltransferase